MAANLTPTHYAQFRVIEQVLISASYARVAGADDAVREFELLRRELESKLTPDWVDEFIKHENAPLMGSVLN